MRASDLWNWHGRVTRRAYVLTGVIAFAVKHNLDRMLAYKFHVIWNLWIYWAPVTSVPSVSLQRQFFFLLAITALPFIWIGVTMTLNRLRDAAQPLWLAIVFFVPIVNLLFSAILCVLPTHESRMDPETSGSFAQIAARLGIESRIGSAMLAALVAALLGGSLAYADIHTYGLYGLSVFIALPFVMGYLAVWLHCLTQPRTGFDVIVVTSLAVLFAGMGILAVALEGLICLLMAAPIAWPLAVMGGFLAFVIHNRRQVQAYLASPLAAMLFVLPALFGAEQFGAPTLPRFQVHTGIDIAAPPMAVWNRLIAFPAIPVPQELPFSIGIAYPIEARIKGEGLTADRECRFSTGSFKEPILAWEPGKHFAFGVADEPLLMKELSPYGNIKVRHLQDHDFQPERGDFVLTPLPNGGTHMEGTTTYQNRMWPGVYWRLWADAIVHSIHKRVFAQIKTLAEADARRAEQSSWLVGTGRPQ